MTADAGEPQRNADGRHRLKECRGTTPVGAERILVEDQVRAVGQVSDRRLCEGPCRRRGAAFRQAGGKGLRLCQVGTGFNRKSSMEIRKKLDAIVSSKSRLGKDPRLKGASWVLRADR